MIKSINFLLLFGFSYTMATAQNAPQPIGKVQKTPEGISYTFWKDKPGATAKFGNYISYFMVVKIGDSTLFAIKESKGDKAMELLFQENPQANKSMDPTEVIKMMSPGDSVVIHAELDSAARVNFPFAKANDKFEFQFALKSVMTQEEYQANLKASSEKSKIQDEKTLLAYFAKNNIKAKKTASGLYYAISKNGVGATPEAGKEVSVNYTGKLLDGTVFDSNTDPQFQHVQTFSFTLGKQMVIAGWDEGLALLNKGAKAVLYIPSYLAYGAQSPSPKIPSNSILIFDVELLDFK